MSARRIDIGMSSAVTVLIACACLAFPPASRAQTPPEPPAAKKSSSHQQRSFATPEGAAGALLEAVRAADPKQIHSVLGPGSGKLITSGDPVEDAMRRDRFVAAYNEAVKIETSGEGRATLFIGAEQWPFPFPLVKTATGWRFDVKSGAEEILNRRIGRNERSAIQVCLAYVDAQREYATKDRDDNGLLEYAKKLISTPGQKDGLYWDTADGEPMSPLGPLSTQAKQQGYQDLGAAPYHGYYYRILTAQGEHAEGGAYDYIVDGKMIGGFALVAYPARWGASGVMTFVCNHSGVVRQKNLGPDTASIAQNMTLYDPDSTWQRAEE
jgi:Protein of unknown function (DUF2950)